MFLVSSKVFESFITYFTKKHFLMYLQVAYEVRRYIRYLSWVFEPCNIMSMSWLQILSKMATLSWFTISINILGFEPCNKMAISWFLISILILIFLNNTIKWKFHYFWFQSKMAIHDFQFLSLFWVFESWNKMAMSWFLPFPRF